MKRTCVKCKGRMTIPDSADIKKAADDLDTATTPHPPPSPSLHSAAGGAIAYLRMFEALANGLCIFCMPPAYPPPPKDIPVAAPTEALPRSTSELYPKNWPRCACGDFTLDGHLTCGRVECGTQAEAERRG